jgi:hypothetical protein
MGFTDRQSIAGQLIETRSTIPASVAYGRQRALISVLMATLDADYGLYLPVIVEDPSEPVMHALPPAPQVV